MPRATRSRGSTSPPGRHSRPDRAIESIADALGWRKVHDTVEVLGQPSREQRDACWELGATVAANLVIGV